MGPAAKPLSPSPGAGPEAGSFQPPAQAAPASPAPTPRDPLSQALAGLESLDATVSDHMKRERDARARQDAANANAERLEASARASKRWTHLIPQAKAWRDKAEEAAREAAAEHDAAEEAKVRRTRVASRATTLQTAADKAQRNRAAFDGSGIAQTTGMTPEEIERVVIQIDNAIPMLRAAKTVIEQRQPFTEEAKAQQRGALKAIETRAEREERERLGMALEIRHMSEAERDTYYTRIYERRLQQRTQAGAPKEQAEAEARADKAAIQEYAKELARSEDPFSRDREFNWKRISDRAKARLVALMDTDVLTPEMKSRIAVEGFAKPGGITPPAREYRPGGRAVAAPPEEQVSDPVAEYRASLSGSAAADFDALTDEQKAEVVRRLRR